MMRIFSEDVLNDILDGCETVQQVKERLNECEKDLDLDVIDAVEGEVIVVSFPPENAEGAVKLLELLKEAKPDNPSIAITKDMDVMLEYPEDALAMLDKMKDKILSAMVKYTVKR